MKQSSTDLVLNYLAKDASARFKQDKIKELSDMFSMSLKNMGFIEENALYTLSVERGAGNKSLTFKVEKW